MKPIPDIAGDMSHLDELTVINPATEQVLTTTRKVFESIYKDKGFEIADRDNATAGNGKKTTPAPKLKPSEQQSIQTGSAAEIAGKLGLKTKTTDPIIPPANDAENGVAAGDNADGGVAGSGEPSGEPTTPNDEIDTNDNGSVASEPRASSGRSRERSN